MALKEPGRYLLHKNTIHYDMQLIIQGVVRSGQANYSAIITTAIKRVCTILAHDKLFLNSVTNGCYF